MDETDRLLIFTLSQQRCALPLSVIEKSVRVVAINPLPKAPEIVLGLINVQGRAIPVLNIRKLFRLPEIEITLDDQIIIANTPGRTVAVLVDSVEGIAEYREEDVVTAEELFPGIEYLAGVAKLKGGIVYIYDLDRFLSLDEKTVLDRLAPPGVSMSDIRGPDA